MLDEAIFDRGRGDAMMTYKGYQGKVEFDSEAGIFHGEVIDTRDVITFQGKSVDELTSAFRDSIEDYLEFCRERGESPEKPYSGQFVTRIPPSLHRQVDATARIAGVSLNTWVKKQLEHGVSGGQGSKAAGRRNDGRASSSKAVSNAKTSKRRAAK